MLSMTGFGKAEVKAKPGKFTVEISSVNNRFLEISTRLPRRFYSLEPKLRALINEHVRRGKITLYLNYEESDDSPGKYKINAEAARVYTRQLRKLKKDLRLDGDVSVGDLLALPEIAAGEDEFPDEKVIWPPLSQATERALKALIAMRKKEGKAMAKTMNAGVKVIYEEIKTLKSKTRGSVDHYREKLSARIEELMGSAMPERNRLEEEVAIFAERTDIDEEINRLKSHVDQFRDALKADEQVGKRLNFIVQEMNREVNTIASKSAEIDISGTAIRLKEEIEKLREMIQNVE